MSNIDLIVLCGGRGSRLKHVTNRVSKPMIKIGNISFLRHLINYYKKYNFQNIYLLAGYKGRQIFKEFNNTNENLISIKCLIEKKPLGTGGALSLIKNKVKNDFVLINGDSFLNVDITKLINLNTNKDFFTKMILIENTNYKSNRKLNALSVGKDNLIKYKENSNLMNSGIYYFKKKVLKCIEQKYFSLEHDLLPKLIKKKKVIGYKDKEFFIDIGTKKQLSDAHKKLPKYFYKPALFLDRDGVLNKDFGYVFRYEDFKWLNGVIKALKYAQKKYYIFIVTNQSGIGRGYYTLKQFKILQQKIKTFLIKKKIFLNDLEFCPHHPIYGKGKNKIKCKCRKPGDGMIKNLKKKWMINMKKSYFIGDKRTDEITAKKSNIKFYYANNNLYNLIKKISKN